MSYAVEAVLLVRLQANRGEWVSVMSLAEHFSLKLAYVAELLGGLDERKQCRVERDSGGQVKRAMAMPKAGGAL